MTNFPLIYTREEFNVAKPTGVYTEIIIDAPPAAVRAKNVDFKNRSKWDPFVTDIETTGNLDDLSTNPTVRVFITQGMDGGAVTRMPMQCPVYKNDEECIVWGTRILCGCFIIVDHAQLFIPLEDGTKTRFVNYEIWTGIGGAVFDADAMEKGYIAGNAGLKKAVEEEQTETGMA